MFSKNLETRDLATAVVKVERINEWWDGLLKGQRPAELFREALTLGDTEVDHLVDRLSVEDADEAFERFTLREKAEWYAARGNPPPEFQYSLVDALESFQEHKRGSVKADTLGDYKAAVDGYRGTQRDIPLGSITRTQVIEWLDSMKGAKAKATLEKWLGFLGQIHKHASDREKIPQNLANPFREHTLPKEAKQSYGFMTDDTLRDILTAIPRSNFDPWPAVVARHSGMRISEICSSELREVDGVLCFAIEDAKTAAGARLVPVRESLIDVVRERKPSWVNHDAISKQFGNRKRKLGLDRSQSFHSLRVTFTTLVARAGYRMEECAWLVGHEEGKGGAAKNEMTGALYFKGYSVELLHEMVEAVPEFDTSFLS